MSNEDDHIDAVWIRRAAQAARLGSLDRAEFWILTPAETHAIISEAIAERQQWERWADSRNAQLMCLIANIHRGKGPPFKPDDFLAKERPQNDAELEDRIAAAFASLNVETIIVKPKPQAN